MKIPVLETKKEANKKNVAPDERSVKLFDDFKLSWLLLDLEPRKAHYDTPDATVGVYMKLQADQSIDNINVITFEAIQDQPDQIIVTFYNEYSGNTFNKKEKSVFTQIDMIVCSKDNYADKIEMRTGISISNRCKDRIKGVQNDK